MIGRYFEEFEEDEVFITPRRTLRESDLINFCNLCWFNSSMFFDEIYAQNEMPFKAIVFPGPFIIPLSVGLFLKMGLYEKTIIALLGIQNMVFKAPLKIGDTMQAEVKIFKKIESKKYSDRGIMTVLFNVNKIKKDLTNEHIMSFEMVHMLKRKNYLSKIT
ncbi:MAG: acyl dehydratase [Candidatus Lokiarchaeota archaeon]|nr:acyl dehydratase [Candidatus Lokiarchaeota archaeon]